MIRFAKLTDYALRVAAELARDEQQTFSVAELGSATRLESTTVAKVLKLMAKAGLVKSFRGVAGGYRLASDASALNVASVVEAMEGPLGVTACVADPGSCLHEGNCGISAPMRQISQAVERTLRAVSLRELSAQSRPRNRAAAAPFSISAGNAHV
jgi:FeS assembly SUF system regulator